MRQREADLLATQSLVREKEAALSQEQQRSSQERNELQGRLADKVAGLALAPTRFLPPPDSCPHPGPFPPSLSVTAEPRQNSQTAAPLLREQPKHWGWNRVSFQTPPPFPGGSPGVWLADPGGTPGWGSKLPLPSSARSFRSRGCSRDS